MRDTSRTSSTTAAAMIGHDPEQPGQARTGGLDRDGEQGSHRAARDKPGWGAKRGASERRYQAMPGAVQRLKLLVEPHPATLRDDKVLYGMQEVRGSNPLSSTLSTGQRHISILKMIFDFLHGEAATGPLLSGSIPTSSHVRALRPIADGKPVLPEGRSREPTWEPMRMRPPSRPAAVSCLTSHERMIYFIHA